MHPAEGTDALAFCPCHSTNGQSIVTVDLGNLETASYGVYPQIEGGFLAMTFTKSKTFKTEAGARRWLARGGLAAGR